LADYNAAILRDPGYAEAFTNRGEVHHNNGDFRRALADLSESLRLRPNDIKTLSNRGLTYRDIGEFDSAVADFDQALRLLPDDAGLLAKRGTVHFAEGKFAAAARDFDRVLAADPHQVYLVFWYGMARARAGADLAAALAPHAARFENLGWPRPLFRRLLGEVDDQAVLAAIPQDDPSLTRKGQCVASFLLGELYLLRNDAERAAAFFSAADKTGVMNVGECAVARLELSRLKP
jgi:lipoprotein NlpI